ncbi:MAG: ParB/RepB/Spo0J family partition protein [Gammaproteobacteria bacterium]|nr:ParB/RepB/Spo0J family partition protein [Gammaproteobacteria bacterium]
MDEIPLRTSISMGLDAIFSATTKSRDLPQNKSVENNNHISQILISQIQPSPFQARKLFSDSAIAELATSISHHGLLQPIILRKINELQYELLAGERRLRAMQKLHNLSISAIVCSVDNATAMAFGLIENIQRENLNAIEEAAAFERLLFEFKISHDTLAEKMGKSRSHITNLLRLNKLPIEIKNYLIQEKISMGHARAILALPENEQIKAVELIVYRGLSVRQTEEWVKNFIENGNVQSEKSNFLISEKLKTDTLAWSEKLQKKYSADIKIAFTKQGRARLQLEVKSLDELSELINIMMMDNSC